MSVLDKKALGGRKCTFLKNQQSDTAHSICFLVGVSARHRKHTSLLLPLMQVESHSFSFIGQGSWI